MTRLVVTLFLLSCALNALAANAPVLLLLENTEADKIVQTKLEVKPGLIPSPNQDKPQAKWIIRAGDAISSDAQPGNRVVNFFKKMSNTQYMPLFIVNVRYFLNEAGQWSPRFQLNEEPLVVRRGDRWLPLTKIQGAPGLIVQTGTALPNAQGYSARLELGFTNGASSIDAWLVQ